MLINLRNAMLAGKRLPYDAEVEYLESTGTQWINLGIVIPPDADFEFTGSIVSDIVNGCIFGETYDFGWDANNPGYSLVTTSNGRVYLRYGNSTFTAIGLTSIGLGNTFTASLSGTSFQVNGQSVATVARISSFAKTVSSMGVFKRNTAINTATTYSAIRINNLKFGNLFDFIPVRKGTVGYFYDRVSGKLFGNAGTGDFVLGQDVVPVEYIESHGTEYIDTGVKLRSTDTIDTRFYINSSSTSAWYGIFGARDSTRYLILRCFTANDSVVNSLAPNKDYDFTRFTWGNLSFAFGGDYHESATNCYLFSYNNNGTAYIRLPYRFANFSITRDSSKIINLLPVRVGTEGAMMDVLTRRIYRNAGTSAFAYGNDLKYPIPAE